MVTKSEYLFAFLCIPSRIILALLARDRLTSGEGIPMWARVLAIAVGFSFLRLWLNPGLRPTGPETFGKPIWWNSVRPIHAILWISFAIAALMDKEYAWKFLAADVIIGLTSLYFIKS